VRDCGSSLGLTQITPCVPHLNGPPLIVTRTDGATPFRLVTHIGDVGHTLVAGPTGMGKSVLLATLALQFRRYHGSRIFAFDMGRSMRAAILGLGSEHYDLGAGRRLVSIVHQTPRTEERLRKKPAWHLRQWFVVAP